MLSAEKPGVNAKYHRILFTPCSLLTLNNRPSNKEPFSIRIHVNTPREDIPDMTRNNASIAIVMGSESDWPIMQHAVNTLKDFNIPADVHILSAHRTPEESITYAREARQNGVRIIIAAAGMAAHLAGAMAAHSMLPVIGVPMKGGAMDGIDALLSTVQMPGGIPVATMALGKAGAVNAAMFSLRILALTDETLARKLAQNTEEQRKRTLQADDALQRELYGER